MKLGLNESLVLTRSFPDVDGFTAVTHQNPLVETQTGLFQIMGVRLQNDYMVQKCSVCHACRAFCMCEVVSKSKVNSQCRPVTRPRAERAARPHLGLPVSLQVAALSAAPPSPGSRRTSPSLCTCHSLKSP